MSDILTPDHVAAYKDRAEWDESKRTQPYTGIAPSGILKLCVSHELLRARLHEVDAENERLTRFAEGIGELLIPYSEGMVCGYCAGRGEVTVEHKPDCLWLRAQAALAPVKGEGGSDGRPVI